MGLSGSPQVVMAFLDDRAQSSNEDSPTLYPPEEIDAE